MPARAPGDFTAQQWAAIEAERAAVAASALTRERARMVVTRFQAIEALSNAGLLASVEAAVSAAGGKTQRAYDHALNFERNSAMINSLGAGLGLSDTQIDDLFRAAAVITA